MFDPVQNQRIKKEKKVERDCLKCDATFQSISKSNRLCKVCSTENQSEYVSDWLDNTDYVSKRALNNIKTHGRGIGYKHQRGLSYSRKY